MSFIWFIIKLGIFDFLYSAMVGYALSLMILLLPVALQSRSQTGDNEHQKVTFMDVVTFVLLLGICSTQGLIVAASVKLSLNTRVDAWWPLWYLVGLGAAIPAVFARSDAEDTRSQVGQFLGPVAAASSYIVACLWPGLIPKLVLRASLLLAV